MRRLDDTKARYVDLSYGWQNRGDTMRLRSRRRRWWLLLVGSIALGVLIGLYRWLG